MAGREAAGPSRDPVLFCRFSAASERFCVEGREVNSCRRRSRWGMGGREAAGRDSSARGQKRSERLAFHTESE